MSYSKTIIESRGGLCEMPLCNSKATLVHHIDGDRRNNELINLITLCASCHSKVHQGKYLVKLVGIPEQVTVPLPLQLPISLNELITKINNHFGDQMYYLRKMDDMITVEQVIKFVKDLGVTILNSKEGLDFINKASLKSYEEVELIVNS